MIVFRALSIVEEVIAEDEGRLVRRQHSAVLLKRSPKGHTLAPHPRAMVKWPSKWLWSLE